MGSSRTSSSAYSGGGFTLGAGYRQWFADASSWDVKGSWTIRNYKRVETSLVSPLGAHGRWSVLLGWRDAPQAAFYGLGIDSVKDNRANFRLKETYAEGLIALRPARVDRARRQRRLRGLLDRGRPGLGAVDRDRSHDPITAPGLGVSPDISAHSGHGRDRLAAAVAGLCPFRRLLRPHAAQLGRSGRRLQLRTVRRRLIQHVPILRDAWVLSFHGRIESTLDDDDVVPFFLLPSLGSGRTLRAYSAWRFRDRHSILGQAEFRWIPNRFGMDWALFYDAGKVTSSARTWISTGSRATGASASVSTSRRSRFLRIEGARGIGRLEPRVLDQCGLLTCAN